MDFLKELLELNNEIYLNQLSIEKKLDEEEKEKFIQKYKTIENYLESEKVDHEEGDSTCRKYE